MESDKAYLERKQQETEWICKRMGTGISVPLPPIQNGTGAYQLKQQLRAAFLATLQQKYPYLNETNLFHQDAHMELGDYRLSYTYQRFDLAIAGPSPYPCLEDTGNHSFTLYLGSGMSSILVFGMAVNRIQSCAWRLTGQADTYFETQLLFRGLTPNITPVWCSSREEFAENITLPDTTTGHILWLDSISAQVFPLPGDYALYNIDLLCYDTSCTLPDADEIQQVVSLSRQLKIPLVLLRSHTKLDFLGTEYARLGSLVLFVPEECPEERIHLCHILQALMADVARLTGSYCHPLALAFRLDDNGRALNRMRVNRIRENHRLLFALLRQEALEIQTYDHGLFITLHGLPPVFTKEPQHLTAMVLSFREKGILLRQGASFGLDITTVCVYEDPYTGKTVLRMALTDEPESAVHAIAAALRSVFPAWQQRPA